MLQLISKSVVAGLLAYRSLSVPTTAVTVTASTTKHGHHQRPRHVTALLSSLSTPKVVMKCQSHLHST